MPAQPPSGSNTAFPIYEDSAAYASWLRWVLVLTLAATLVPGIALVSSDPPIGWTLLGTTAFDALLFYAILPRRFQILPDRLRIVLGRPFAVNIPLSTVKEVRPTGATEAAFHWGMGFVTSTATALLIVRNQGLSVVISPANRETFVQELNQALRPVLRRT